MINYSDIIISRGYDSIFIKYGRKTPILVLNNEYMNTDDPMLNAAKEMAISDMIDNTEYIHPELIEGE